jgi:hypothetical protein
MVELADPSSQGALAGLEAEQKMKNLNLCDIGKMFRQRANRDPGNAAKQKAHDLSRELWHSKKPKEELLAIIAQLKPIERAFTGIRVYYADIAEKAVREGNYEVIIPHEISHRYGEQLGRVYVLTSSSRPGGSCPWAWCRLWLRWSPAFSG